MYVLRARLSATTTTTVYTNAPAARRPAARRPHRHAQADLNHDMHGSRVRLIHLPLSSLSPLSPLSRVSLSLLPLSPGPRRPLTWDGPPHHTPNADRSSISSWDSCSSKVFSRSPRRASSMAAKPSSATSSSAWACGAVAASWASRAERRAAASALALTSLAWLSWSSPPSSAFSTDDDEGAPCF